MKKITALLFLLVAFGWIKGFAQELDYKYYVRLLDNADRPTEVASKDGSTQYVFEKEPQLTELFAQFEVRAFDRMREKSEVEGLTRTYLVDMPKQNPEFENLLKESYRHIFEYVEASREITMFYTPNDYQLQGTNFDWHLDLIDAPAAWDISQGNPNVFIGITEPRGSKFNTQHVDLDDKIVGHVDIWPSGWNEHGTAVAVTAAGETNNGAGISSIGHDCRIYTMLGSNPMLSLHYLYGKVRVVNMSWGADGYSQTEQDAMTEANLNGIVLVAAAGYREFGHSYPAGYNHVISVTSIGDQMNHEKVIGDPSTTHHHGSDVDLVAPGYQVPVAWYSGYALKDGNSFAAPMVSGLAGLILSVNPCLNANDVEYIMKQTAFQVDQLAINQPYVGKLGAGLIQAEAALIMAQGYTSANPYTPNLDPSFNHFITCDDNLDLHLSVSGKDNPLSTYHQFNLYEQSNTNTTIEDFAWWQVSPNGYNRDTATFNTILSPNTNYMVKRGVWDDCQPWKESRVYNISAPSCFVQFGYGLQPLYEPNGCVIDYEITGQNQHLISHVVFNISGPSPSSSTDYSAPFRAWVDPFRDNTITATIHFTNGKTYTVSNSIPRCDRLNPWRGTNEYLDLGEEEFSIYPNPSKGEVATITYPRTARMITIVSVAGKKIKEVELDGSGRMELDLEKLEPGLYYLQLLHSDQRQSSRKLMIE